LRRYRRLRIGYVRRVNEGFQWIGDDKAHAEGLLFDISNYVIQSESVRGDTKAVQVCAGGFAARLGKAINGALAVVKQDRTLRLGIDEQARREWKGLGEAGRQVSGDQRLPTLLGARENCHLPKRDHSWECPFHGAVPNAARRCERGSKIRNQLGF